MKTTYTATLFNPILEEARFILYFTETPKYDVSDGNGIDEDTKVEFTGVKSWTIVEGGEDAELCEKLVDKKDEYDEYLILNFKDKTEIYRNSHVVMFVI